MKLIYLSFCLLLSVFTTMAQNLSSNSALLKHMLANINRDYKNNAIASSLSDIEQARFAFLQNTFTTDSSAAKNVNSFITNNDTEFNGSYCNFVSELYDSFITNNAQKLTKGMSLKLKNLIYYYKETSKNVISKDFNNSNDLLIGIGVPSFNFYNYYEDDSLFLQAFNALSKRDKLALNNFIDKEPKNWIVFSDANRLQYNMAKNYFFTFEKKFDFELVAQVRTYLRVLYNFEKEVNHNKMIIKFPDYVNYLNDINNLGKLPNDFRKADGIIHKNNDGSFTEKCRIVHKFDAEETEVGKVEITYANFAFKPIIIKLKVITHQLPIRINDYNNGSGILLVNVPPTMQKKAERPKQVYKTSINW